MKISGILTLIVIVLIVICVLAWLFNKQKSLSAFADATTELTIAGTSLPQKGNSENYTYSIWIYVDQWTISNDKKIIFSRGSGTIAGMPMMYLDGQENNVTVSLLTYPDSSSQSVSTTYSTFTCGVKNVPLQNWTNLIASVNGRSLDIYMNGKLVRTCVLPGVPFVEGQSPIYLTPNGGFSGYTAKFNYWADAISPQQAWNIYKSGPGGNILGNLLNQYKIQVNFMKGNETEASITI
jgi:hypothetical protein